MYGDEKRRQMARSILPSTSPGLYRELKRHVKHSNRSEVRRALRCLDEEDFEPPEDVDVVAYPDMKIRGLVQDRRDRDKIGPFTRWAVESTKDIPIEDRLTHLRAVLPQNLIGRHAIGHIDFRKEFDVGPPKSWMEPVAPVKPVTKEWCAGVLEDVCRSGWGLGRLHAALRKGHVQCEWFRKWVPRTPVEDSSPTDKDSSPTDKDSRTSGKALMDAVGPHEPPQLKGLRDIPDFLATLFQAADVPWAVKCTPYVEHFNSFCGLSSSLRVTRRNPDRHPEWKLVLVTFLRAWVAGEIT